MFEYTEAKICYIVIVFQNEYLVYNVYDNKTIR